MKKVFFVLFALLIVIIAGAAFFLLTFNADQYRPLITEQLQKTLGKPVKIEKISFGLRSGIALSLRGLVIANDPGFQDELIRVDSASAVLNLAPLLSHEVQISSIYINEPKIRLVRKANGAFLGFEPKPDGKTEGVSAEKKSKGGSSPNAAAVLSFLVDQIRVDSGEVIFVDESGPRVVETHLRDVDLKISNAALDQPVGLDLEAALLSPRQNVLMRGEVKFSSRTQELLLESFHAEIDLDSLDLEEIARLSPEIASSGLEQLSGKLQIETAGRVPLNEKAAQTANASLQLQEGKVRLSGLASAVDHIVVDLGLQSGLIKIRKASAVFAGGGLRAEGQVNLKTPKPLTAVEVNFNNISMESLAKPSADPSLPQLQGNLSGSFQGTFTGSNGLEMQRTAAGEGTLTLEKGVIKNLNILREVFRKLSMIPGLVDNLRKRLPENYQDKLDARDTLLETVQLPFVVKEGMLLFNRFEVQTDSFALQGGGSYGILSGMVGAQANLFVEPELSAAFIKSVKELEYLTDRKSGALMIPMNVQGRVPKVSVSPDLQYIASRLAVSKTQDVLGSLLKGPQAQTENSSAGGTASASAPSTANEEAAPAKTKLPKGSQILGALLQSALQGDSQNADTADQSRSQRSSTLF